MGAQDDRPGPGARSTSATEENVPRVVLKFHDSVELPYDDHAQEHIARRFPDDWKRLVERFPDIRVSRLFFTITADDLRGLVERAKKLDGRYRPPNFFTFFAVDCPAGTDPELVARALRTWESVEEAYVQSPPTEPPNDPLTPLQAHLGPAARAIDALYAWQVPGGDGRNVRMADIELGWTRNHQDLPAGIPLSGDNHDYFDHGTSVLGVVVAPKNGVGGQGIAFAAQAMAVSEWRTPSVHDIPDAIMYAAYSLQAGDILLIEAQVMVDGLRWPVEVENPSYHAVRLAAQLGISVVEAAGNGPDADLTNFDNGTDGRVFDPASRQCRDSRAIMVAAGTSSYPHHKTPDSNYGRRVDCYAWGDAVYTATTAGRFGTSTTDYNNNFGGTSAAAAMIAGAAASVQGMALASSTAQALDPLRLRSLLRDSALGTPAQSPDPIGVMPNLRAIAGVIP